LTTPNLAFIVNTPQSQNCHLQSLRLSHRDANAMLAMASTAKFSGEQRSEFHGRLPHRLVGDIQTAFSEQIFGVAIAERETHMEPNGVPENRRQKPMAGKRDRHAPSHPSNGNGPSLP
jgi:hypothetical protein